MREGTLIWGMENIPTHEAGDLVSDNGTGQNRG